MPSFSSPRERRLWLLTLAVVIAIYSTLGLAEALVDVLRDRDLLNSAFVFGFGLVLATIATEGLRLRPRGWEIGLLLGISAAYLMVIVRMGIPAVERTHLIEYGVVAVFVFEALRERRRQGLSVPRPALLAILATSAIGLVDELIQAVMPSRTFDPRDIFFNVVAAVMSVTALALLGWTRARLG